ncbi:hypothetical protein GUJ93_ZPchr0009g112 [Zizania palustris]|uniref:Uncharacterized protein n=1 Tax=Zizania palustris TaxID=103762 RepID=A0A8J5RKW6_ZIZPA|nr:hypothetical protein GUJ93_ZPchr0009g112 [Zizania palustris]
MTCMRNPRRPFLSPNDDLTLPPLPAATSPSSLSSPRSSRMVNGRDPSAPSAAFASSCFAVADHGGSSSSCTSTTGATNSAAAPFGRSMSPAGLTCAGSSMARARKWDGGAGAEADDGAGVEGDSGTGAEAGRRRGGAGRRRGSKTEAAAEG